MTREGGTRASASSREDTPGLVELALGVFFLSYGVLSIEIAFTRIFSYAISYHFAYLTIATALLGFGSAGSVLSAFPRLFGSARTRLVVSSSLAGLAAIGALAFSSVVRFDPMKVGSDFPAFATLALYDLVITVPFFFAGIAVVTVLASRPDRVGTLYGIDLAGAALGCAASVPVIWAIGTPAAVVLGAAALAASALCYVRPSARLAAVAAAGVVLTVAGGLLTVRHGPFPPSPDKFLAQFLESPDSFTLDSRWTPISRVDGVGRKKSETSWMGGYAFAGLGKGALGGALEYRMISYDGGSLAIMYQWDGNPDSLHMLRHHLMATPYKIRSAPETLIIGFGGGADALAGIANGVGPIKALELNPVTVELGRDKYSDFNGGLFSRPGVEVVNAEARHWIESHPDQRFDLVVLNSIDTLSALSTGAYVLAESYLYTTDAFRSYLERLKPGGIFALFSFDNFGVAAPTFIMLRFAATLETVLEELGAKDPASQMVILASPGDVPLVSTLTKLEPFTAEEIESLERYAEAEGFTFWHKPNAKPAHPVSEFLALDEDARAKFIDDHFLRLDPVTDTNPFFFNFYSWSGLLFPRADDTRQTPATGQRILLVMLAQAVLVSVAMILWPLRRLESARRVKKPFGLILYFSALGLGFIFLEIVLLQRFVLFLGYPTYSLSVVMFSLLVSAGAGSALSARWTSPPRTILLAATGLLVVLVGVFHAVAPEIFGAYLSTGLSARIAISIAMLAPLGLVLGTFFPTGIRMIEAVDPHLVPWAWAVNGCMTVIGTILSVVLGMTFGFGAVAAIATALYVAGTAAFLSTVATAERTGRV
jgi:SAM-dependent methyltransferase